MNDQTKASLIELAQKYETAAFLKKDPSQFMHRYNSVQDKEIVAFISANLAFGRREQILLHIEQILDRSGSSPVPQSQVYRRIVPYHPAQKHIQLF